MTQTTRLGTYHLKVYGYVLLYQENPFDQNFSMKLFQDLNFLSSCI
jgi:hypothetical protein